jgi:hypothetical protein
MQAATPRQVLAVPAISQSVRLLATQLGGDSARTGVPTASVSSVIDLLVRSGQAKWAATGKRLISGEERAFDANSPPRLPPKSAVILGDTGPWYVDATTGAIGRVRLRQPKPPAPVIVPRARRAEPSIGRSLDTERIIVERPVVPVLRMRRLQCPDDYGRLQLIDALTLEFDYGGVSVPSDDERQFVRVNGPAGPSFVRRNTEAESGAMATLREDGFVQMRVADGAAAKGRLVLVFRGREAAENWHRFVAERVPALQSLGWRCQIEGEFGPRMVEAVGDCDVRVGDAERGSFSLDFGIDIDGVRHPLLPILSRLLERGGMDAARIVGDEVIASLEDGRVIRLPAERTRRLLAIMGDLIENSGRAIGGKLVLPDAEAPTVLELEDLLATRWQDAATDPAFRR